MKSWKTTSLGVLCLAVCAYESYYNIIREAWPLHYWGIPIALGAVGLMGIFARDHSHKEK